MKAIPDLKTVPEYLAYWVKETPDNPAFTFIGEDGKEAGRRTYAELDRRARAVAGALSASTKQGDRVLLVIEPGLGFMEAFLGCLFAGVIAVPTYPPDPARLARSIPRLRGIADDCQPSLVIVSEMIQKFAGVVRDQLGNLGERPWLPVESVSTSLADTFTAPRIDPQSIAFLQYTSGSTGLPKGVQISHANLVANTRYQYVTSGPQNYEVGMSWAPPYHDMGLIGTGIIFFVTGGHTVHMSPATYLRKPIRWLEALHQYRATATFVPPFALEYTARKVSLEQRAMFDLSNLRLIGAGGEPVPADAVETFEEQFKVAKLSIPVCPGYGLAENTVYLCHADSSLGTSIRTFDAEAFSHGRLVPATGDGGKVVRLCSNGRVGAGVTILIVDPTTGAICPEGTIGEMWLHSDSVAQGYWKREEETRKTFGARYPGDEKPYLRTGDLVGVLNGELFITGRIKELIIIRGRNHYPLDIERTIETSHPNIRPGCCAVFMGSGSDVVAVAELQKVADKAAADMIRSQILAAVAQTHGIHLHDVALIEPRSLPKALNGKMARNETRTAYLSNALSRIDGGTPLFMAVPEQTRPETHYRSEGERYLAECLEHYLGRVPDLDRPCSASGLDSIQAFQLACDLEERLGLVVQPQMFIGEHTWKEALASSSMNQIDTRVTAEMVAISKSMPATRLQTWIMNVHEAVPGSHVLSGAWTLHERVPVEILQKAVNLLVERRAILRTSYRSGGRQMNGSANGVNVYSEVDQSAASELAVFDGAEWSKEELRQWLEKRASVRFDLSKPPLIDAALVRRGGNPDVFFVALHHISADDVTMTLLIRELGQLIEGFKAGEVPPQPEDHSLWSFAEMEREWLDSTAALHAESYWRRTLAGARPLLPLGKGGPTEMLTDEAFRRVSSGTTAEWKAKAHANGVTLFALLLAGFARALHQETGVGDLLIGSTISQRNRARFRDRLGPLFNLVPLRIDSAGHPTLEDLAKHAAHRVQEAIEYSSMPFGNLVNDLKLVCNRWGVPGLGLQVNFTYYSASAGDNIADIPFFGKARPIPIGRKIREYDLYLFVRETNDGLICTLRYNDTLLTAEDATRLLDRMEGAINGL